MTRTEEMEFVHLAQAGDGEAFARLYEAHRMQVLVLLRSMTHGQHELAADLSQEVFLRAYRVLDRFRGDSKFSTWLYRITVNTFLMWRRKYRAREGRHPVVSLDAIKQSSLAWSRLEPMATPQFIGCGDLDV